MTQTSTTSSRRPAARWPLLVGLAVVALTILAIPVAAAPGGQSDLAGARAATASFHDLAAADAAGYVARVADLAGITCIESSDPAAGGMGVHFLNPSLVPELFDSTAAASIDATTPELLVYAPGPNGQMRLVALEYLTPKAAWLASHAAPPALFGRSFDETPAGNRYGLPDFYSLHAWIWSPNSTDLLAPYNPSVNCP